MGEVVLNSKILLPAVSELANAPDTTLEKIS
jgi:hypothetical protein